MKEIPLTQGKVALVDDDDFERVNQHKWYCNHGYAYRSVNIGKKKYIKVAMHRFINNTPDELETDHINGNKLDNRKCNLRNCTAKQNKWNTKIIASNTTGYKGVDIRKRKRKNGIYESIRATIYVDGKLKYLGKFDDLEDAARAYNREAIKHFGEFANLNKVTPIF